MMAATATSSSSFSLRDVKLDDLLAGTGPYTGLQKSVRLTFKCLTQAIQQQANEMTKFYEQQTRHNLEMAALQEQVQTSAVSMRTVRTLLEGHVEALRAEFSPKLRGLEARVQDMGSRLVDVEQQQQRHYRRYHFQEDHSASSNKEDNIHQVTLHVERMQADLTRLARTVERKADQEEVAAALQQRVNKASLAKRIHTILEEDEQNINNRKSARSTGNSTALMTAHQRLKMKLADQEEVVLRILQEMEAVKTYVLGSGDKANGGGEDSITTIMNNLQSMLQQQGRRLHRTEKDVAGLRDRLLQDHAALDTKVEERCRALQQQHHEQQEQHQQLACVVSNIEVERKEAMPPLTTTTTTAVLALEERVRAFESNIVKELDVRDAEVRRHLDSANRNIRALEAKVQCEESRVEERLNKAEDSVAFQSGQRLHVLRRVERLEQQQLNLTAGVSTARVRSSSSARSPISIGHAPTISPAATSAAVRSFNYFSTPDPLRAYQNVQQQEQQQQPQLQWQQQHHHHHQAPQHSPPSLAQARLPLPVGGLGGYRGTGAPPLPPAGGDGGGSGGGGTSIIPARPSTSTMTLKPEYGRTGTLSLSSSLPSSAPAPPSRTHLQATEHPHQQRQKHYSRDNSLSQHPPPPLLASPESLLPHHLYQQQEQPPHAAWPVAASAGTGGGGGGGGGGGEGEREAGFAESKQATGGISAAWCGSLTTASSPGSPTPGEREGRSATSTGGMNYSLEKLEALRVEKLALRTRIVEEMCQRN